MPSEIATRHQLHGVQPVLTVADVSAAATYFADVLGFEIDFLFGTPASHGRVMTGDGSYGQPIYIHLSLAEGDEIGREPTGELRLHVGHDLDGLCATYRARGAHIVQEPVTQPWGLREFVVLEENGHYLRFCGEAKATNAG
jgi:uncharacterized glyoxalase superfamily protein PhnB